MNAAQRRLLERLREAERKGACNIQCVCGAWHHVLESCASCGARARQVLVPPGRAHGDES